MSEQVLIGGAWQASKSAGTFRAENPKTKEPLPAEYPVSSWADCDAALAAASIAAEALRKAPPDTIARFLDDFADRIDAHKDELAAKASEETALPVAPRLADVELPRTSGQLRQAAADMRSVDRLVSFAERREPFGRHLVIDGSVVARFDDIESVLELRVRNAHDHVAEHVDEAPVSIEREALETG